MFIMFISKLLSKPTNKFFKCIVILKLAIHISINKEKFFFYTEFQYKFNIISLLLLNFSTNIDNYYFVVGILISISNLQLVFTVNFTNNKKIGLFY